MARSIRASVGKRNRATLRKKVFGPVVDARTERLAAKLQELASQPRPKAPEVKSDKTGMSMASYEDDQSSDAKAAALTDEAMDVDTKPSKSRSRKSGRVQKTKKPRNNIVFKAHPSKGKSAIFDEADTDVLPVFDKVIFMVVDALRSDFVFSNDSGFLFTQSLIRAGAVLPFTAHASAPTVTMPRLKAITTGSVPSFLDVILNIAESDTTSTLAYQDTWLAQLRSRGDRLVMYGDDTWLKLFPGMFERADGTTSFFVSDFVEVDQNVTRHVPSELAESDWSALIMHYLGLDHIGHKAGPRSPFMRSKQQEMDAVVKDIYTAMQQEPHLQSTLLVLCGDHGMNDAGNHGGSSAGETSPALLFVSPKFQALGNRLESPVEATDEFQYYRSVEQADITPTLAGLLGLPIPLNSLGVFIPEFLNMWDSESQKLDILYRNARQLLNTVKATFPGVSFDQDDIAASCASGAVSGIEGARCAWFQINQLSHDTRVEDAFAIIGLALQRFSRNAQEVMSSTASDYNVSRLALGLLVTGSAVLMLFPAVYQDCARSAYAGGFLGFLVVSYGSMMFASSYVEEEQQFWYWICSGWIVYLHIRSTRFQRTHRNGAFNWTSMATLGLIVSQRILRRWNQTGQKFTAEPDIARSFLPSHPLFLWTLVILTYMDVGRGLFLSLPAGLPRLIGLVLPALAFWFKLNFVANDSPELLAKFILSRAQKSLDTVPLVLQARLVFGGIACCIFLAIVTSSRSRRAVVSNRLVHEALNLFLMTQSRATNIPVFLLFRIQGLLLAPMDLNGFEVTVLTLMMQYMTFFVLGGSNAISSVDLSSGYNGVDSYSATMVGILTFASNWAGPIWWVSMGNLLRSHQTVGSHSPAALFTFHVAMSLISVMAACTALRTHLFIWTVFSPKYLYSIAWATANHVLVNVFGGIGLATLRKRQ
ncbi:GPI ethanolamine phosphate transferase 2 [Penicillium odoratum]|uniref:GPI ethanolamine phosphate transferase 2 n=1 Tax=Penicillium odoratum TaxID=1167516 RepID=UPI002548216E|nr:GPI ethanolamine phosphate transferase 2 [Penicillium odoratum]KAJ5752343.1 GPI ethanolamine phosphate transferase 2 [Penicillium odoratum]